VNKTKNQAHIYGAAVEMSWMDASQSLTDLIFSGVTAALKDADMTLEAADSIVLGASDLIDGRSLSSMVTAPAAGAYMKDEIRLSEDGLAAASFGAARIEAGESQVTVVAAWGRASEGDPLAVSRAGSDPFLHQPLCISEMDVSAFRLSRWLGRYPDNDASRRAASAERQRRAAGNPHALHSVTAPRDVPYPLREDESCRWGDVVAAMVIGKAPGKVLISGVGHGTDHADLGERDLLEMPALRDAARLSLDAAGINLSDVGLFEIDGMTLSDEALSAEAVGLCPAGDGFRALAERQDINPSGGSEAGWCYPAMGLVRLIEAYQMLRAPQGPDGPRRAMATGLGGGGAQTATAIVLEKT